MRIIRNYFLKEFSQNFFYSFLSITFVLVLGNLIKVSDLVIRKGVHFVTAGLLFLYYIPYLLEFSLPLACLLGVLLSVGRISSDNELVALKVAGISFTRILAIFLTLGVIISLFLVILNDRIIPQAHFASRKVLKEITKENPLGFVEPGVFIDNFKDFILFTHDVDANILKKVFIYEIQEGSSNLIYADRGEFVVERDILKIKLQSGFIEGPAMKYRIHFQTHFMHLPIEKQGHKTQKKPKDMTIKEIRQQISYYKQKNIDALPLKVELHRKLSLSFSSIVFVLLGFGVAGLIKHREKSINFSICFCAALAYYLLSILGEALVLKGILPVTLGMWFPNIIFSIIGGFITYRICAS